MRDHVLERDTANVKLVEAQGKFHEPQGISAVREREYAELQKSYNTLRQVAAGDTDQSVQLQDQYIVTQEKLMKWRKTTSMAKASYHEVLRLLSQRNDRILELEDELELAKHQDPGITEIHLDNMEDEEDETDEEDEDEIMTDEEDPRPPPSKALKTSKAENARIQAQIKNMQDNFTKMFDNLEI
ncbi:hypothetical protein N7478_009987 [Penicillium angulare]|uniref:uncharacterized protein n=1 Tax=Penicillium angulare TaxID=116970 RepID=UPI0025402F1F|nr:uncharacterized protein N7478_009987 [Penicillium angulare]KAJ5267179.1 hypothetical protein N7478_009987 [Penicillium angulare]